jgi:hypothetical protein
MEKTKAEMEERENGHTPNIGPKFYPEKEMDKQ